MGSDWLRAFLAGDSAPHMALLQLFISSDDESAARAQLDGAIASASAAECERLSELTSLWAASPDAYAIVSRIHRLAIQANTAERPIAALRNLFDGAAAISPEAGVALYSLGDPAALERATSEVIGLMRLWRLFTSDSVVAEIGCGSGRFLRALAPLTRAVVGLDISEAMLRRAGHDGMHCRNLLLLNVDGSGLAMLRDSAFDLVLAIDSFPYIVQAGAGNAHFADCARVLKPGGQLLIMNFAYSVPIDQQRVQVAELAERHGFAILRNGSSDLQSWDGRAFLLRLATPAT